ncbi:hypothetical protein LEMLEM_LOCUS15212 [Lemmus lemmus]
MPADVMKVQIKERTLKRRISNGWQTFKELLNILNHQGNANPNDSDIPPYICQNG